MSKVQEIIDDFGRRKKSIACNGSDGMLLALTELHFEYREADAGHRVFSHDGLPDDFYHSIDCGHKPKKEMKFPYVVKTIRMLRKYQQELEDYYDEKLRP